MRSINPLFLSDRNSSLSLAGLVFLFALTGCQHTYQVHVYQGPHLSEDKLAKVTLEVREQKFFEKLVTGGPYTIHFEAVDCHDPEEFGEGVVIAKDVYVLPGIHTFGITFRGPNTTSYSGGAIGGAIEGALQDIPQEFKYGRFGTELQFDTAAGHRYMIRFKETTKPWKGVVDVKYWVEDVNSGNIVFGEKPIDLGQNK